MNAHHDTPPASSWYTSSHNHGSQRWVLPIVVTFQIQPFSTSMIMGEKVIFRQFSGKQPEHQLTRWLSWTKKNPICTLNYEIPNSKKNTTNFQCFELINLAKLYMNSQTLAALAWSQGHFGTGYHPKKTSTSTPGSGLWRAKASTNSTTWPFTAVATPWKSHLCETSTVSYLIHLSKKSF